VKYEEAIAELQNIVDGLENETIGMDELSENIAKGNYTGHGKKFQIPNPKHQILIPNRCYVAIVTIFI